MNKNGKPGKLARQRAALARLEEVYKNFKASGEDKPSWTTTRNGGKKTITHTGRTYEQECKRLKEEIDHLKEKMIY